MENQLKARLIGASVLVVLAVLVIPEMLSGRKSAGDAETTSTATPGMRKVVIDLGGAVAAGAKLEPATAAKPLPTTPAQPAPAQASPPLNAGSSSDPVSVPDATASMPAPATSASAAPGATKSTQPAVTAPKVATAGPVITPAPDSVAVSKGGWAVQVGAFGSAASANKLIGELRRDGFPAFEAPLDRGGKTLHRVRVGPEAERAAANQLSASLKARGLPATVVAND